MQYGNPAEGPGAGKRRGRPTGERRGGSIGRGQRGSANQIPPQTIFERLEANELSRDEAVEKAREAVLRILTAAQRSRYELKRSLERKGYPEDIVAQVLDRFDEVGLVDDVAYAETIVRTRHTERGLARRGIAAELHRRGIDEETAVRALNQLDPDDERAVGAKLAIKLINRTVGLDHHVRVRRAVGSLARKGYAPGLAFELVREALALQGEEMDGLDDSLGST